MLPFHLHYTLSRRQRLAVELHPWLPAIAGSLGFVIGAAYLSLTVTPGFLLLLLLPVVVFRGLFGFVGELVLHSARPVEVIVDDETLEVVSRGQRQSHQLTGIIQVFRSEDRSTWTVLHLDGLILTIPTPAITAEQLDYLKGFARRAAEQRRAAQTEAGH
jgi:hypothetical protein